MRQVVERLMRQVVERLMRQVVERLIRQADEAGCGEADEAGCGEADKAGCGEADEAGCGEADEAGCGEADEAGCGEADEAGCGEADEADANICTFSESTMAKPLPIPTLTVLPPSSDTESWSRSPSPRPHRTHRTHRNQEKRRAYTPEISLETGEQDQNQPKRNWNEAEEKKSRRRSLSPRLPKRKDRVEELGENGQGGRFSPVLLRPSRSRWSLRSLLSKDSDWDSSCRSVHKE
ncbi:hypothetical protein NFI96_001543 [Prochilodus magdalenae]|nr:hypothetical protein NFI96_001543 [Prochilodus magdalenae]